jgi:uncharacterized protein (DUF2141 family)
MTVAIMPRAFLPRLPRAVLGAAALAFALPQPTAAQDGPMAPAGCTGPESATWVRVLVEGVRSDKGLVAVTLYADDASRFLVRHGSLYVGRVHAEKGTTEACIFVPHAGTYALAIYHDANGNQKFDRTMIGLPAEAYGFSNNPNTFFGLPSFGSVRYRVTHSGQTVKIRLTYP